MNAHPMYEQRNKPPLSRKAFFFRLIRHWSVACGIMLVSLGSGILGYHAFEGLPWIDALVNAAMILGGMGPVNQLHTTAGKLFASVYALFSGLAFIAIMGIILAPFVHRLLHRFHWDADQKEDSNEE